jgi:hypothetical protein
VEFPLPDYPTAVIPLLKADTKTMKIPASESSIRELVVNVSGIILDEKWNAKEAIIDAWLEVEGEG